MEKFERSIPEEPNKEEGIVKKESVFTRMNKERRDREYTAIREQMAELNSLLTRRDGGAQGLDTQIKQVGYKLRSSVEDFCRNNPTDERGTALKELVGLIK